MYIQLLAWKWIDEKFDIKWMYLLCFIFVDTAFLLCGADILLCCRWSCLTFCLFVCLFTAITGKQFTGAAFKWWCIKVSILCREWKRTTTRYTSLWNTSRCSHRHTTMVSGKMMCYPFLVWWTAEGHSWLPF